MVETEKRMTLIIGGRPVEVDLAKTRDMAKRLAEAAPSDDGDALVDFMAALPGSTLDEAREIDPKGPGETTPPPASSTPDASED